MYAFLFAKDLHDGTEVRRVGPGGDGHPDDGGQVADMARRFPMMAERQVVIVKEAQNIKNWDRLEQYFEKPQTSTVLVIAYKNGTIDGRKKILAKALAAGGVVFESKKKRDYELPAFIESYLKTKKATIDNKACSISLHGVETLCAFPR